MSEYDGIKRGKLILKGHERKAKKRKHKKTRSETEATTSVVDHDAIKHGGWWKIDKIDDVKGPVAVNWGDCYIAALDNGHLALGPLRKEDGPAPEEVLTAVPAGDGVVAFKTGYGKYTGINQAGAVMAVSDAIGPNEKWTPIWEDGNMAIMNNGTSRFLSLDPKDDSLIAKSITAKTGEFCVIRSQASRVVDKSSSIPIEDRGSLDEIELNYVKKFQKFQDKKIRLNQDGTSDLKRAKTDGNFHETLLDRRSKMKADRYCK